MKCKKIYIGTYIVAKLFRVNGKRVVCEKGLDHEAAKMLALNLSEKTNEKHITIQEFHTGKYFRFVPL